MLGQNYFERRLGDIYNLSPIPYIAGDGQLCDGTARIHVQWELNVSVTGNSVLVLSTKTMIDSSRMATGNQFVEWYLVGHSADGDFTVDATGIILSGMSHSSAEEYTIYFVHFSHMALNREGAASPTRIEALVRNLDFIGLEWSHYDTQKRLDKFYINANGRQVYFHKSIEDERIRDLIKIDRLDRAILGEIHVPINAGEPVRAAMNMLEQIEWLTAFFTMNRVFSPLVRLTHKGDLCSWRIAERASDSYRRNNVVDNHLIPCGLKNALESTFDNFVASESNLDLRRFIDMVLIMRSQKYPDFMLAGLLLCYEFFTTMFLTDKGKPPSQNSNVQKKLNQLNSYLRFIPKDMLDDTLREDIRNPLFHQGAIVGANVQTLWAWYTSYLDLLIQIVLVVLGYKGRYISPIDYQPTLLPTPASKR